jgi:hypothetical protein
MNLGYQFGYFNTLLDVIIFLNKENIHKEDIISIGREPKGTWWLVYYVINA